MPRHKHTAEMEAKLIAMIRDAERTRSPESAAELRTALTLLRPPYSDADAAAAKVVASALRRAERDGLQHIGATDTASFLCILLWLILSRTAAVYAVRSQVLCRSQQLTFPYPHRAFWPV